MSALLAQAAEGAVPLDNILEERGLLQGTFAAGCGLF
jgi:hypothetical protein